MIHISKPVDKRNLTHTDFGRWPCIISYFILFAVKSQMVVDVHCFGKGNTLLALPYDTVYHITAVVRDYIIPYVRDYDSTICGL